MAVDPKVKVLVDAVVSSGKNKRATKALLFMLEHGQVSTDDLLDLGYSHPPRAIGDVRDAGIPIVTGKGTSRTGNRMAIYSFGDPSMVQEGRIGGRSAFPKAFKNALVDRYNSADCITGAVLDPKVLQIDHRVPYRVAGDAGLDDQDLESYMLLDGSSQRAKSWACEHCPNMLVKDIDTCRTCFWAYPEEYLHIATEPLRRIDVVWQGGDVAQYDRLVEVAQESGTTPGEVIKRLVHQIAKAS